MKRLLALDFRSKSSKADIHNGIKSWFNCHQHLKRVSTGSNEGSKIDCLKLKIETIKLTMQKKAEHFKSRTPKLTSPKAINLTFKWSKIQKTKRSKFH